MLNLHLHYSVFPVVKGLIPLHKSFYIVYKQHFNCYYVQNCTSLILCLYTIALYTKLFYMVILFFLFLLISIKQWCDLFFITVLHSLFYMINAHVLTQGMELCVQTVFSFLLKTRFSEFVNNKSLDARNIN